MFLFLRRAILSIATVALSALSALAAGPALAQAEEESAVVSEEDASAPDIGVIPAAPVRDDRDGGFYEPTSPLAGRRRDRGSGSRWFTTSDVPRVRHGARLRDESFHGDRDYDRRDDAQVVTITRVHEPRYRSRFHSLYRRPAYYRDHHYYSGPRLGLSLDLGWRRHHRSRFGIGFGLRLH